MCLSNIFRNSFRKYFFGSVDAKFRVPRLFSNRELKKFAHLFSGSVVNVSGWTDEDKDGSFYKDYFLNASEYWISNFARELKGMQGQNNEFFLNLEEDIDHSLIGRFDVVFNHTTLEHIYDFKKAFKNLSSMTNDVLIVIVPYIQQMHGSGYSDYWRFTPHAMQRLYHESGLNLRYCSANGSDKASIYLFCIGYKNEKWSQYIPERYDLKIDEKYELYGKNYKNVIGGNVV